MSIPKRISFALSLYSSVLSSTTTVVAHLQDKNEAKMVSSAGVKKADPVYVVIPPCRPTGPCFWSDPTDLDDHLLCGDGTLCDITKDPDGWACCAKRGKRVKCPKNHPQMCKTPNSAAGGTDYACWTDCTKTPAFDVPRPCPDDRVEACPWLNYNILTPNVLTCVDFHECNTVIFGWDCCDKHGGRLICPSNFSTMCADKTCTRASMDLEKPTCECNGGPRECPEEEHKPAEYSFLAKLRKKKAVALKTSKAIKNGSDCEKK